MKFKKGIISLSIASIIAGCSNVNIPEDTTLREKELIQPMVDKFESDEPAVLRLDSKTINVIKPNDIPKTLADKEITLSLSENATIKDLPAVFQLYDISLIISKDIDLKTPIYINSYKGSIANLFDILGALYGITFNYHSNNVFSVEKSGQYVITVPQNKDLLAEISKSIKELGATDINTSIIAGNVTYRASVSSNEKIMKYMKEFGKNAALIGLQIAIVTVNLDKDKSTGFDWSKLQVAVGNGQGKGLSLTDATSNNNTGNTNNTISNTNNSTTTNNSSTTNTGTGTSTTGETSTGLDVSKLGNNVSDLIGLAGFNGTNAVLKAAKGDFNFSAAINYLSTYGNTKTNQSVLVRTVSGKEVALRSGQTVPYVSGVSNSSVSGSDSISSGTQTEKEETGLTLKMTPYYDSETQNVNVDISMTLKSILSFVELSAGNQIGTITQPNTQEQEFSSFIRMRAGESSIIGGVTYESVQDDRSNISYIETSKLASQKLKTTKNALFILLRPSVTVFGDFEKDKEVIKK